MFDDIQMSEGGLIRSHDIGTEIKAGGQFLVSILPYPTKEIFLAGKDASSAEEVNQLVIDEIKKIMLYFRAVAQANPQSISILAGHANIDDAVLRTDKRSSAKTS